MYDSNNISKKQIKLNRQDGAGGLVVAAAFVILVMLQVLSI